MDYEPIGGDGNGDLGGKSATNIFERSKVIEGV